MTNQTRPLTGPKRFSKTLPLKSFFDLKICVGISENGRQRASRRLLITLMSRAGLEPATHWLKAR
jgi:hypothetical protein